MLLAWAWTSRATFAGMGVLMQGNRILKNNWGRGAGFRSGTTSTAFNLC